MYTRKSNPVVLSNPFSGLLDDIIHSSGFPAHLEASPTRATSIPVNMEETESSFELSLPAPGLKKEDFILQVTHDVLNISYTAPGKEMDRDRKWLRREFLPKSFTRNFNLNNKVDVSGISAKYLDGILYLSLPKKGKDEKIKQQITVA
jgi:HSP20 family protein